MMVRMMTTLAAKTLGAMLVLTALASQASAGASPPAVPEIDPTAILGAITLFSGGVMLLTDRRRSKTTVS